MKSTKQKRREKTGNQNRYRKIKEKRSRDDKPYRKAII